MKLVIAGSRGLRVSIGDLDEIIDAHYGKTKVTEVVCGGARGVDECGLEWAVSRNIKVTNFEPDWKELGRKAGFVCNRKMAEYADAAVVIHRNTPGSVHMIRCMEKLGKPCVSIVR